MKSSYLVIVNPVSGNRSAEKLVTLVERELSARKLPFKVCRTVKPGHATEIVTNLKHGVTDVVAVGGDGTINEIVNGIKSSRINLGIVPAGSGNDFVKTLLCPPGLEDRVKCALFGGIQRIDTGVCNGRIFVNGVGIGFDGKVVETMLLDKSRILPGRVRYMLTVLGLFLGYRETSMRLTMDKKIQERELLLITIGNGTTFGGGYKLCPNARLDDGVFELCIIGRIPVLRRFMKVPLVGAGKHSSVPEVSLINGREITVSSALPLPGHIDGDFAGYGPYKITMHPKSLSVRIIWPV